LDKLVDGGRKPQGHLQRFFFLLPPFFFVSVKIVPSNPVFAVVILMKRHAPDNENHRDSSDEPNHVRPSLMCQNISYFHMTPSLSLSYSILDLTLDPNSFFYHGIEEEGFFCRLI
jgi:hypothetical protein